MPRGHSAECLWRVEPDAGACRQTPVSALAPLLRVRAVRVNCHIQGKLPRLICLTRCTAPRGLRGDARGAPRPGRRGHFPTAITFVGNLLEPYHVSASSSAQLLQLWHTVYTVTVPL